MCKSFRIAAIILAAISLTAACEFEGHSNEPIPGTEEFLITVIPSESGGFEAGISGGRKNDGIAIKYPGVTARLANPRLAIKKPTVSPLLDNFAFKLCSISDSNIERLWLVSSIDEGLRLDTPHIVNARGLNVLVIGPLAAGECVDMSLDFTRLGLQDRFQLTFKFIEVMPRIAFSSDRPDPKNPFLMELYSILPDGSDMYRITRGSKYYNGAAKWSPGGEWLAFERQEEISCGGEDLLRPHIYIIHPDGSNLKKLSVGMYLASSPSFGPDGKKVAFDCQPTCLDDRIDTCVYDFDSDSLWIMQAGDPFYRNRLFQSKWSPDGTGLVFRTLGSAPDLIDNAWFYVDTDPVSGDTLGLPLLIATPTYFERRGTYSYRIVIEDFVWAPDSAHTSIYLRYLRWNDTLGYWQALYNGNIIIDIDEIIQYVNAEGTPWLPYLNPLVKATYDGEGNAISPEFSPEMDRLYFDTYYNSEHADLRFVLVNDFTVPIRTRIDFLADGYYNRHIALFTSIIPYYYPNW